MNYERSDSGGGAIVAAVLILILVVVLGVAGLGFGFFYLTKPMISSVSNSPAPPPIALASGQTIAPRTTILAQYPLAAQDVKDTLEAPSVAIDSAGHTYLAYASQTGDAERTLFLARFDPQGHALDHEPIAVRKTAIYTSVSTLRGKEIKRSLRLLPKLAVSDAKVILGWIEPNPENTTVVFYVAESADQGATFGAPIQVHKSLGARPTFIALAASPQGDIAASWLDNRAGIQQPFASVKPHDAAEFNPEAQVYASVGEQGVCPCCPTATLITNDGRQIVAFRNQLEGVRDMYVAERPLAAEAFGAPQAVRAEPTWKFDGCPHDGPSLATDATHLYISWMDASLGATHCFVAARPLAGGDFDAPLDLDSLRTPATQGNASLAALPGGGVLAVWEETESSENSPLPEKQHPAEASHGHPHASADSSSHRLIYMAALRAADQGVSRSTPEHLFANGSFQTRPIVAVGPDGSAAIAWNDLNEHGKQVVLVRLPSPPEAP
jgi:hypothetical protein